MSRCVEANGETFSIEKKTEIRRSEGWSAPAISRGSVGIFSNILTHFLGSPANSKKFESENYNAENAFRIEMWRRCIDTIYVNSLKGFDFTYLI